MSLESFSRVLGCAGLAFILIVMALATWNQRQTLLREAREHAAGSAFFLADQAQRLFEVSDLALRSTTHAIDAMDWDAIEQSQDVWKTLRETDLLLPYVDGLWLNDASGRLRLTTITFPPPSSIATDRDIFIRTKTAATLVIGERIVGKVTNKPTFLVARRLGNPDGTFRGMVSASLDLAYFTDYWSRLDLPNEERVAVVRAEAGDILASYEKLGAGAPAEIDRGALKAAIADNPEAGAFNPAWKTYGYYHRVGDLPLYVTVEFTRASIARAWLAWMVRIIPLSVAAFAALLGILVLGVRQGRREALAAQEIEAAREALRIANSDLERRVADRTADLRESNEEIQRFAYIVSHDLRAPLVNITGFTSELQSLREKLFETPNTPDQESSTSLMREDFDEAIGFIQSSTDKMDRLIRAILSLSRQSQRRFHAESVDMTTLMQSILDGVAHRIQKTGATVTVHAMPDLFIDRMAVEQIFSNLIDNAVKYLRPDVPGRITITGARSNDRIRVTVEDNGRGIEEKDRERVFELFRRAGQQDQPGEGIGLAHVRALVRRLGGQITFESTPGTGCVFTVVLPDMPDLPEADQMA